MNKLKRLLALTICLLLTLTSLPVTQLVASADDIVALQLNNFTSTSDMPWTFPSSSADFWKTSVDNGGYKVEQIKSDVVNASYPGGNSVLGNFVVESNVDNRTETVATGIEGKMRIDLDFEALVLKNPESTNDTSYMNLTLTSPGGKTIIYIRVSNTGLTIADNATVNSATYKRTTTNGNGWNCAENPDSVVLSIEYDSTTGDIATYFDGELMTKNAGVESDVHKVAEGVRGYPIGKVSVSTLSRINVGSYIKFNDIKFTQYENSSTTLAALPEKLVDNVNGATETSVTLPTVSGVTWASADTSTATVSGNTLTLIPSEEGTKEVEVTATFTEDVINYVKTYKMTLAKVETTPEPEPEPEPEPDPEPGEEVDGIVSVDKTFNYASATEALADGWKINDDSYRELTVDENGYVKYNQLKQCDVYTKVSEGVYKANNGSGTSALMYSMPKGGVVAIDEANGTKIINETGKYVGKLQVEVDVEMDMKPNGAYYLTEDGKATGTPLKDGENDIVDANGNAIQVLQPQFNLTFAPNIAIYRLRPGSQNYINNGSEDSSTITNKSNYLNFTKGNNQKLIITVDTNADTTTGTIAGAPNVAEGPTINDTNYFLQLQLSGFQRMEAGSNFTFKGVKVITKEAGYGPEGDVIVAQLPEKLVADVTNVTEATVTLPSIEV